MSRKTYVYRDGKFVEVQRAPYRPRVGLITDTIPETYCHATGRSYTSRSERNLDIKASGATDVDSGYEIKREVQENFGEIREDLERAYYDIRDGNSNDLSQFEKAEAKKLDERDGYKPLK